MSGKEQARRTDISIKLNGTDISEDVNKYLLSFSYTDEEEDKSDDLSITIDDREGVWLRSWLNSRVRSGSAKNSERGILAVGDRIMIKQGAKDYNGIRLQSWVYEYEGFTIIEIGSLNPDRIVFGINGVVTAAVHRDDIVGTGDGSPTVKTSNGLMGASVSAAIIQRNFNSDGKDSLLDCGTFQIDTISVSGAPSKITLKGTSLANTSTIRAVKKSKAWEKIRLSSIAKQISERNGMKCYFSSEYDPLFTRREQIGESDIVFLQRLCKAAGISLKVTAGTIVLFDEAAFERKDIVQTFECGKGNVLSYDFSDSTSDTSYSSCHVSYTDPSSGKTIEYTYTPRVDNPGTGEVLEVSEKVNDREEARKLAMKRLRQKNKNRFSASLKVIGNTMLAAGTTVGISGWGDFDGKYIIATASHSIGNGYTTSLKLRKVLEEY